MPTAAYSQDNLKHISYYKKRLLKIQITCTCHKLKHFNLV